MAANAQIVIELDEKGVIRGMQQISAEGQKLEGGLRKVGSRGNVVFTELVDKQKQATKAHREATEAVQLLSSRIGIELPRAVSRWIAALPGAQRAFQAAFSGVIIGTLIAQVIQAAFTLKQTYDEFYSSTARTRRAEEALGKFVSDQSLRSIEHVNQLKLAVMGLGGSYQSQLNAVIGKLFRDVETINKLLELSLPADLRQKLLAEREAIVTLANEEAKLVEAKRDLDALEKSGTTQAALALTEQEAIATERLTKLRALHVQVLAGMKDQEIADAEAKLINIDATKKLTAALGKENDIRLQMSEARFALNKQWADTLAKAGTSSAAAATEKMDRDNARQQAAAARRLSIIEEISHAERAAAIEALPEWQRAYAGITESATARVKEINHRVLAGTLNEQQQAQLVAATWAMAGAQIRNQLAGDLESAFEDMLSGRFWQRILKNFQHMVFQMIAAWMLGQRAMAASSAGAAQGGGFSLGGLLGGLLGIGGPSAGLGTGSALASGGNIFGIGGVQPTFPSSGSGFQFGQFTPGIAGLAGLPMSAGGGVGMGGIIPAGATVSSTAKLGLGAQLAAMWPMLVGAGGLLGGRAIGFSGPGRGALAGGLMGAGAVGLSIAALMGPLAGMAGSATAIGALFGPLGIGIVLGGILLGSLLGKSAQNKQKAQAMDILNSGRAQWRQIISDFEGHRTDYASAVAGVTQVWQQMVQQWSSPSLGKYGGIAIRNNEPEFRRALQQLDDLQAKRQWFAQSPMYGAAGEFSTGGFVSPSLARPVDPLGIPVVPSGLSRGLGTLPHFAGGGPVPIIAHTGEFVMQRSAVERIGRGKLEAMNRGGSSGPMIVVQGPLVQAAPGMSTEQLAEATIRKLETLLRDQGVSLRA